MRGPITYCIAIVGFVLGFVLAANPLTPVALGQEPPAMPRGQSRASATQVGTVMALLATFQEAGALPLESSPEANQLIKALIQFQAAFMKSRDPAVSDLLARALEAKLGGEAPAATQAFRTNGWTSESLEALVDFVASHPPWGQGSFEEGLRAYHVERQDFELLARVFVSARRDLQRKGENLHQVYRARRLEMPGGRTAPKKNVPIIE
ncbi:MAG: hypothetical protein ACKOCD_02950 [Nitrospiraceae bacterium]